MFTCPSCTPLFFCCHLADRECLASEAEIHINRRPCISPAHWDWEPHCFPLWTVLNLATTMRHSSNCTSFISIECAASASFLIGSTSLSPIRCGAEGGLRQQRRQKRGLGRHRGRKTWGVCENGVKKFERKEEIWVYLKMDRSSSLHIFYLIWMKSRSCLTSPGAIVPL